MPFQHLIVSRYAGVEHLTLNRPDVHNAFNEDMISELTAWAAGIRKDDSVRAVILKGAGKTFCAGADITWMARVAQHTEEENLRDAMAASKMFSALNELPVPLVCSVHGAALGGGIGLAAVCDVVIAEEAAVFGFTEVKLGIIPAVISPFVLAKIGRSAARELFLMGTRFGAARAREIGLVHAVVGSEKLDITVNAYVSELVTGGREAMAAAKALIATVEGQPIEAAAPITAEAIARRRASAEGQEGLKAFLEKRKPRWSAP